MPKSLAFWSSPPKNAGFRGKIENVLEMASAKYRNLFQYLKKKAYPEGFTKQKTTLRKFAKKFEYDSKLESLFYVAKEKDGTALRRLVIAEEDKARVFEECHSAPFSGHAGRDNTLRKIKEGFYWPDYHLQDFILGMPFPSLLHGRF